MREKLGNKFEPKEWDQYIQAIATLFDDTTPSFLTDYVLENEEENLNIKEDEMKEKD